MEFNFRDVDDRLPTYPSPSSSVSYFTEQASRAGCSTTDPRPSPEQMRNPNNVREVIQRELEKERIREDIIVAEIARRRVLEAEVRRELMMMEREMAMRRHTAEGLSLEERLTMRFDSRLPLLYPSDGLAFPGHGSGVDMFPMSPLPEAMGFDIKPPSEINKDKLIILAKPNPNLSGARQKAVTPSASELPPFGLKKRPKEEWSCATNERVLSEHLQGKKHKAKETGLGAQRMGKTPLPKESTKPSQLTEIADIGSSGLEARVEGESLQHNKIGGGSDHKIQITENLKNKSEQVSVQKNRVAEDSKKTNGTAYKKQKKFKFWCEMCQIGANSRVVMETHKNGKKHRAQLQNPGQKDGVVTAIAKASSDDTQKAVDTDFVKFKFWCEMCQIFTNSQVVMETHKNGKKHRARLQNLGQGII